MKYFITISLSMLFFTATFSQGLGMEFYYPENKLYAKNKVKSIIDSISDPYINIYDSLGRMIHRIE